MKKGFLLLITLATFLYGCSLFGGKGTGNLGELTGVMDRPEWDQYQPAGMVSIPPGSFHMGQNDQDVPYSQIALKRQITISGYYMDEMEITNNEYRQFVYGPAEGENAFQQNGAYDTIDPMYADIIMPDTTVWTRDFTYAYNEPLMENYFWHPAFDNYPVVGVSWYAADQFCKWRSAHLNQYREERELAPMPSFRLPSEAEWEYAARGGLEHKLYPWEGPYLRNSKGCFLANFKPGRGDYIQDGYSYTAPVDAYFPNGYGLFNMPGNVAEWCQDDFEETGYQYAHDMNPVYKNKKFTEDDRTPGGAQIKKVTRGGSWKDIGYFLSCGTRAFEYADTAKSSIGFRCVVTIIGRSGAAGF